MEEYRAAYRERVRRIAVTLSQAEYDAAKARAEEAGVPLATYARRAVSAESGSGRREPPRELAERLAEFVRQVRGVATNVNQMAKHSNALRAAADSEEVMLRIRYLEELVRKFVEGKAGP